MLVQQLKNAPQSAGIYQFFDESGLLLYVGKAKVLKHRVKSYFRFSSPLSAAPNLSLRILKMVQEIHRVEYIVVQSEHDALILENSLIKQLKPKYNILLRDDKTYPYITINLNEAYPRFEVTRKVITEKNRVYFGPLSTSAKALIDALYLAFPLVQKRTCIAGKKACLFHQINRCLAPCEGKVTPHAYARIVEEALLALRNQSLLIQSLSLKMHAAAEKLNFEEARTLRDIIAAIKSASHTTHVELLHLENFDVFAIVIEGKTAAIMRLFIREGKIVSTSHSLVNSANGFDKDELYERALFEFYHPMHQTFSKHILLADPLENKEAMETFLQAKFHQKITITTPKRGDKYHLTHIARNNARTLLEQASSKKSETLPEALQNLFDLGALPKRIEVFDNSHLGGSSPVGAMIVWEEGFVKSAYRKYALSHKDEYAQMKEMLERRIKHFSDEAPPDLWILDGGQTLLNLAVTLLQSHGIMVDVLSIAKEKIDAKAHRAKGSAKDTLWNTRQSFSLSPSDKRLQFIQRLRDEAHRFAITYHQTKKRKNDLHTGLLEAHGVGPGTLKKLLHYFGSFEAIYQASCDDLELCLGEKAGKNIFNFLKK